MILNAVIHGSYCYAESWPEKAALITEVMENLRFERRDQQWVSPGEVATFMFAARRHSELVRDWWPDNALQIAVNSETGYGGLVWYATQERISKDEISEYIWVSDNPNPPDFDPRVVSDSGVPYFFDPRSTLPIIRIRAALEEFCRLGTGNRPESIEWVHGEMNGQRNG
ncbi:MULTISPECIES: Imm1 family immunity protein [Streptacidiphilus]|uniref:Imm1 family immunity protein n=1 Tax=Streptacidiphilus cavernicola TaxID=3342716 RepID=A0ABV6UHM3_9ACTN|nr:Imm1 family immunity protein [Streptacidiphilus jeojiense]